MQGFHMHSFHPCGTCLTCYILCTLCMPRPPHAPTAAGVPRGAVQPAPAAGAAAERERADGTAAGDRPAHAHAGVRSAPCNNPLLECVGLTYSPTYLPAYTNHPHAHAGVRSAPCNNPLLECVGLTYSPTYRPIPTTPSRACRSAGAIYIVDYIIQFAATIYWLV